MKKYLIWVVDDWSNTEEGMVARQYRQLNVDDCNFPLPNINIVNQARII